MTDQDVMNGGVRDMTSAIQIPDILLGMYDFLTMIAPIATFISLLALGIGLLVSPRVRLFFSSRLGKYSKLFDKTAIGDQCAVFMKPRIKSLNSENSEAMLPMVKLEFTRVKPESTKVDPDDNVIIVLKDSRNYAKNLFRIAERYVEKGVMPRGRSIVDNSIVKSVEAVIMLRLLKGIDESLRLWDEYCYRPCKDSEPMREVLPKVHYMDESGGTLTRLFLPQLELVARRLGPSISPSVVSESREWFENVYSIALKHHEDPEIYKQELGRLSFIQEKFGVQVVLVAASRLIAESGINRHKRRVIMALNNPQISEVYIIAVAERNCFHGLRLMRETYGNKHIREVWPVFYRTKSRGEEHVPVVLIRYIKGPLGDEEMKKQIVRKFDKATNKKLKQAIVTPGRLMTWLEENGEQYMGTERQITKTEAGEVAKMMNNEDMTMDVLPYLFEFEEMDLRCRQMIEENEIEQLGVRDEIVYRIHALMGDEDSDIIPVLDPNIFMKQR